MTKLFALIAAFGLVAAPAFAIEAHKTEKAVEKTAEKMEKKEEATKDAAAKAEETTKEAAPAAGGEMKKEETTKKAH